MRQSLQDLVVLHIYGQSQNDSARKQGVTRNSYAKGKNYILDLRCTHRNLSRYRSDAEETPLKLSLHWNAIRIAYDTVFKAKKILVKSTVHDIKPIRFHDAMRVIYTT